ncbi:preprotein translocase subunit YajC [Lacticaseibacillus chiayiensis]|uniref:preprotein translocase subunit YajC n=1 Tax=Lacticaseibacillus chiayiensis TaxID=2100821 RepID=UPI0010104462|nr:preprotein translocase subunit YajC [Lacticaseibacillus chiayiensis]RXT59099.1 preprotein translocase subunit YajC [Lacticaseibacillus chiayiensis]
MIILIVFFIAFMYFFMIRPQKKQQQKRQEMLNQLKKGDPIVTIGGLHGVIDSTDQQAGTVVIDSDGIYLTFNLSAVRGVASRPATPAPAAKTEETVNTDEQRAAKDDANATTSEADSQATAADDTASEADNKQN